MNKDFDREIGRLLKTVVDHFDAEDRSVRERQIRHMRRLKLYWNNFSMIYWSEVAHDYRLIGQEGVNSADTDQDYYDRPVNVFKAFLETIIAALSIQIPAIACVPDDADNPNDILTAKAGDQIAELIYKHNNAIHLWLHALYIYCTEGMIAYYTYPDTDKKYGTYEKKKFENQTEEAYACPNCGMRVPDEEFSAAEMDEFAPDEDDAELHAEIESNGPVCIECGLQLDPALQKSKLIVKRLVGITNEPKTRIRLEVYGGLYVKIANYAKKQCDTPYLNFSYETHYVNALEQYPHLREKLPHGGWSNIGVNDPYEQYGRLNTQYRGEFPTENVTCKNSWLRVEAFNILPEVDYKKLKRAFPDGVKVVLVNDICADYENEKLDDCWTLSENPMSDFLNHDPLGDVLTNIQDIVNDLISLTLQTIEHGIGQTFVDPAVISLNGQKQIEATPGTLTATVPQGGSKNISEAFYQMKAASLSPEIFNFYRIIQELGQFVSGALPSLFGGQNQAGSSRTASEYAMSKGMALQRLQTPWKMMTIAWKETFGKAIPAYIKCVVEDERHVKKDKNGNFINTFIKKAELDGKIGDIELEPDDKMPITDEQQADMIMELMKLNNQEVMAALMDPENIPFIRKVVKIPQFRLPGEDDRQKQLEEIKELINGMPILDAPDPAAMEQAIAAGQPVEPQEKTSVEIDVDVDNHGVEASICRSWLISDAGRMAKIENPNGYKNVLLHMKAHMAIVQQQMVAASMMGSTQQGQPGQETPPQGGKDKTTSAPAKKAAPAEKITGESNANTPIA